MADSMRVAIANRGEVAVRIIRACQELGFTSILLHSTPDAHTVAARIADETFQIKGSTPLETYLNADAVVGAAVEAKAQFLHPGFGFLSENAAFAEKVGRAGIIFVGPRPEAIRAAGNKIKAKELAKKAGVPVVPSYTGKEKDPKKLLEEARKIGFPCIVKAAAGGGGKGMKVVRKEDEFFELYESAQREAVAAFGDETVFMEKYLERPRHIEIQVLFDNHGNGIHFFERECSIQRRHQKIFEETPSSALNPELRLKIAAAALKIAGAAGYSNAGTVEFLLDSNGDFYFMELNSRLQVEHTVTEMVCGVDLVHLQFSVAQNLPLLLTQEQIVQRGHALEVRLYSEDPEREFLPSTGKLAELILPLGPHRRFDIGYANGDDITPFYDPMIGKIITWAPTRGENIDRMFATLSETVVFGVHTNIEFLKAVLKNDNFRINNVSTQFLAEEFKNGFNPEPLTPEQKRFAESEKSRASVAPHAASPAGSAAAATYQSPWSTDAWPHTRPGART